MLLQKLDKMSTKHLTNSDTGYLYGIGNEIWIGLATVIILIVFIKYLAEYIFPSDLQARNGNGNTSTGVNQGLLYHKKSIQFLMYFFSPSFKFPVNLY